MASPEKPLKNWKEIFEDLDELRRTTQLLRDPPIKELIDEGRNSRDFVGGTSAREDR